MCIINALNGLKIALRIHAMPEKRMLDKTANNDFPCLQPIGGLHGQQAVEPVAPMRG
jgi:hypothetical protein